MANDTRASRKSKDEESSSKPSTSSSAAAAAPDSPFGLRRSTRESSSKKSVAPSPPSTRKSERLEKQAHSATASSPPAAKVKSDRLEKQSTPSPVHLRRSERGKKQTSNGSSFESDKSLSPLSSNKKHKKKRSVRLLTLETEELYSDEEEVKPLRRKNKQKMNSHAYRAFFKKQQKKGNVAGHSEELSKSSNCGVACSTSGESKLTKEKSGNHVVWSSEDVDKDGLCTQVVVELGENCVDLVKTLEMSSLSIGKPAKINSDNNFMLESLCSDQKCFIMGEAHQTGDADRVEGSKVVDPPLLQSDVTISRHPNGIAEGAGKEMGLELENHTLNERTPIGDGSRVLEGGPEIMLSKRKRNIVDLDSDDAAIVSNKDLFSSIADDDTSSADGHKNNFAEKCVACFKRKRNGGELKQQELCSCNAKVNQDLCITSSDKGRGEREAGVSKVLAEQCITNLQRHSPPAHEEDEKQITCFICNHGGQLLYCEGRECQRRYHLSCVYSFGVWHCPACVIKKIKSGVHSVSQGIESIWDVKEVDVSDNGLQKQKQFFVKYMGLAHAHNQWVPEHQLLLEAPSLVARKQVTQWKHEWTVPRRLLRKRLLISPKLYDEYNTTHAGDQKDCQYEWLVKWCGLDYEHATWELDSAEIFKSLEAQSLIKSFENRFERAKKYQCLSGKDQNLEAKKGLLLKLFQLSTTDELPLLDETHLDFINNCRAYWYNRQNAIIINDQEGIQKVVSFVLSLLSDVVRPFLVITNVPVLHSWDGKFLELAPSVDAVVYHGNKGMRKLIRSLEFYEEGGGIMFQVLITSPDVILEDLSVFDSITWEATIVDECESVKIQSQLHNIRVLRTDMRLLLVNGQLTDGAIKHMLSLLDSPSGLNDVEGFMNSSNKNGQLGKLSNFVVNDCKSDSHIANGCKSDALVASHCKLDSQIAENCKLDSHTGNDCKSDLSRFVEYWVPVQISNMQLEQYCATLLSKSPVLCAPQKNDFIEALREILISNRKCCDHPYITDPNLQTQYISNANLQTQPSAILEAGIKASGKLQLLDIMLPEIKERGLKVLILYQFGSGSGKYNIGDILDDFMRQRYGQDSYERIDGCVLPSKKQAALHKFNNEGGRFVFLLETRACVPSIKLSSVDVVIIFGSDWNPVNDLRNLQKITLESQSQLIKLFRLYSSFTLEEKVLILARQNKTLDIQSTQRGLCQLLLMWGATYLFNKLNEFHTGNNPATCASIDPSFFGTVKEELFTVLSPNCEDSNVRNSLILKVKQNQELGNYCSDFLLHGELKLTSMDEEPPHLFWKKQLGERQPQWKFSPIQAQRNRKRVQHIEDFSEKSEVGGDEVLKKRKKVAKKIDPPLLQNTMAQGISGVPANNVSLSLLTSTGCLNSTIYQHNNLSEIPEANVVKLSEGINSHESQKNLRLLLKPQTTKLCEILQLPERVKDMAESFLEYVMDNHNVSKEPATILQAFQISLCWTAASLLKHKLNHKESLALAKKHLNFECIKEEADYVYSMLRCLKKVFLHHSGMMPCSPKAASRFQDNSTDHLQAPSYGKSSDIVFDNLTLGREISDSRLGLAQQDFSKSIIDIEKKCQRQMKKLLEEQQEEIKDFDRQYKEEKAKLQNEQKTEAAVIRLVHSTMRTDMLKSLDIQYAKKFEEFECQMKINRKDLEDSHLAAQNKLQEKKDHWVDALKSWAVDELMNRPVLAETMHNYENSKSLDASSQDQIPEKVQHTADGPGTSSLDGDQLEVVSTRNGSQNVASENATSSERQVSGVQITQDVAEAVRSGDGLENSINKSSFGEKCHDQPMVLENNVGSILGGLESAATANHPPSEEEISGADASSMCTVNIIAGELETCAPNDISGNVVGEEEVCATYSNNIIRVDGRNGAIDNVGQDGHHSSKAAGNNMRYREVSLGAKHGGDVLADKIRNYQDPHSSHIISRVNQEGDICFRVSDAGPVEIADCTSTERENNGACTVPSDFENENEQDRLDASGSTGERSDCGNIGWENSRVCTVASDIRNGAVVQGSENQSDLQQVDTGNSHPHHGVATDELSSHAPVVEFASQTQLVTSAVSSTATCIMDLPSTSGVEREPNHGGLRASSALPPTISMQNQMELAHEAVLQPVTQSEGLPAETPSSRSGMDISVGGSMPGISGTDSYHFRTTPIRMPLPLSQDPLQNELERIRAETDKINNYHEEKKLQLKSDCEKEIQEAVAQIRRKYDSKFREIESLFLSKKNELDANHSKVLMNKILAEAFRSKCMDIRTSNPPAVEPGAMQTTVAHTFPRASPPIAAPVIITTAQSSMTLTRPSPTLATNLAGAMQTAVASTLPRASPPITAPSIVSTHSSSTPTRPPHIGSLSPASGNLQVSGGGVRAPAPHLQPFRPSPPTPTPNISYPSRQMSSQPEPRNAHTTSPMFPQSTSPLPPSANKLIPQNRAPQSEAAGILPSLAGAQSALELLREVDRQASRNLISPNNLPPLTNPVSNSDPLVPSPNATQRNPICTASEVVCLSDDD